MIPRLFLVVVGLLGVTTIVNGQVDVHLGVTTAFNATFVLDDGLSQAPRYRPQQTFKWAPIGFNAGIDLSRGFGLSLESILAKQGQIYDIINVADQVVGQRNIQYECLQLPLLMRFMSKGNSGVRGNFNLGPQLSILTRASEIIQYSASTQTFPKGATLPAGATDVTSHPDGSVTATVPAQSPKELASKETESFKNAEFQIAAAVGMDIDLARHFYLTVQARGNYSVTDLRNSDAIEALKQGKSSDVFGKRANLTAGVQMGLHFVFGSTRSFKYKGAKN
ncbi:outer membrane beta-barrel protein [Chryseolinea sp. T2]|uniref:outer membrane beta-barrel protein n=1 Tax=Chryseolinea sp. T2 TaxID=3129255 RepID=UPI003077E022